MYLPTYKLVAVKVNDAYSQTLIGWALKDKPMQKNKTHIN